MPFIDISHTVESGLISYPGLPAPHICDFLSREESRGHYEEGTEFSIQKIEMVGNTGTYIDCPFHRYTDGKDFTEIKVEKLANLPGIVVRAPYSEGKEIDKKAFENLELKGKAVLIHTSWDIFWGKETYYTAHPFVTEAAAKYLADQEVALVGIDALNIDDTNQRVRPVHTILLGKEIPIIEHLTNLKEVPDSEFYVNAVPPKIAGVGSFPVRAFAHW